MKPIPAKNASDPRKTGEFMPSLPGLAASPDGNYSPANRRSNNCNTPIFYPWLLVTSTLCAALFCYLYLTKPVVFATDKQKPEPITPAAHTNGNKPNPPNLLIPGSDHLPGETGPKTDPNHSPDPSSASVTPTPPARSIYEETNIKIQHILTADAPSGHVKRLDVEVPVLYQSRNLRWSHEEISKAHTLLARLMEHQDKTRKLQSEGLELLQTWNQLISKSIPSSQLRADSPSLPDNQDNTIGSSRPADLNSKKAIQIKASKP